MAILEPVGVQRHNVPHFKGLIKLYMDWESSWVWHHFYLLPHPSEKSHFTPKKGNCAKTFSSLCTYDHTSSWEDFQNKMAFWRIFQQKRIQTCASRLLAPPLGLCQGLEFNLGEELSRANCKGYFSDFQNLALTEYIQ